MDTFMDKLSEKFTAQELIKANAAAETEEMERLKAQVKEYTECLNRMQQICADMEQTTQAVKTQMEQTAASVGNHVTQAAESAREKMDSAQINTDRLREDLLKMMQEMKENAGAGAQSGEQRFGSNSDLAELLTAQMDTFRSAQSVSFEDMKAAMELQISGIRSEVESQLAGISGISGGVQPEELQSMQDAQLENLRGIQAQQLESIKDLQAEQLNSIRNLQQDQIDNMRSVLKAQLSGSKDNGQTDFIMGELESQRAMLEGKLDELKSNMEEQLGGSNEFVHRECVKVYRNVQAVVGEENNKQSENLDYTFSPMKSKLKNIFTVSVIALIASVASIVIQIVNLLNIF